MAHTHGFRCDKTAPTGNNGFPDRLLTGTNAGGWPVVVFIEVKRPGETLRPLQIHMLDQLYNQGQLVYVIDSTTQAEALIKDLATATTCPYAPIKEKNIS